MGTQQCTQTSSCALSKAVANGHSLESATEQLSAPGPTAKPWACRMEFYTEFHAIFRLDIWIKFSYTLLFFEVVLKTSKLPSPRKTREITTVLHQLKVVNQTSCLIHIYFAC